MSKGKEKKSPEKTLKQKRLEKRNKKEQDSMDISATVRKRKPVSS
ncbi:hypothetical protein SAMN05661010_00375 [Modicisalibacter muralis]|uniref:Uncharacterized protein n=1 Tax=Modicisalibacter muralis TaxID=119000 RepID=A0A1G9FG34_9GAMM|nr:hypothetical protein [Halomonas muralis]SDK87319.1 hypothetical protein SAMN05661010_00375 [Halomonas muralis]